VKTVCSVPIASDLESVEPTETDSSTSPFR
jgi:hypothetical protein